MLSWKWLKPWEILIFSLNKKSRSLGVQDGFIQHSISTQVASAVLLCHPQHGGFYPQAQFLFNSRWLLWLRHHTLSLITMQKKKKNTSLLLQENLPTSSLMSHWPELYHTITGKEIEVLFKYSCFETRVLSARKKGSKCGRGEWGGGCVWSGTFSIW